MTWKHPCAPQKRWKSSGTGDELEDREFCWWCCGVWVGMPGFRVQDKVNGKDWMLHFLPVDVVDEFK